MTFSSCGAGPGVVVVVPTGSADEPNGQKLTVDMNTANATNAEQVTATSTIGKARISRR
jgi:hypothetical protein